MNYELFKILKDSMDRGLDELGKRMSSMEDRMDDWEANQKKDNRSFDHMAAKFAANTEAQQKFIETVKKNPEKIQDKVVGPMKDLFRRAAKKKVILTPEQAVAQIPYPRVSAFMKWMFGTTAIALGGLLLYFFVQQYLTG